MVVTGTAPVTAGDLSSPPPLVSRGAAVLGEIVLPGKETDTCGWLPTSMQTL